MTEAHESDGVNEEFRTELRISLMLRAAKLAGPMGVDLKVWKVRP